MKLIDLTCNKCGAQLKVNAELSKCTCNYCGNEMLIDQEIVHHQIDNAQQAGYEAEISYERSRTLGFYFFALGSAKCTSCSKFIFEISAF